MLHQIHRKGGFPHGGAGRHYDQIRRLEPRGHLVEIRIARRDSSDPIVRFAKQLLDLVDRLFQHRFQRLRPFTGTAARFGDLEDLALGLIQQIASITPLGIKARLGNLVGNRDHLSHHGPLTDDLGIGTDVGGTRCVFSNLH